MLPRSCEKEKFVDILLNDNERVVADGTQQNLTAARAKRYEDAKKIEKLQNTISARKIAQNSTEAINSTATDSNVIDSAAFCH